MPSNLIMLLGAGVALLAAWLHTDNLGRRTCTSTHHVMCKPPLGPVEPSPWKPDQAAVLQQARPWAQRRYDERTRSYTLLIRGLVP